MRITSLVENTTTKGFPVEHGLSLHIEMNDGRRILFDMGQGTLFATNAKRAGIDPSKADLAIVSHGHYDHGGGLATYLSYPGNTPVYIHKEAFEPHYSLRETGLHYIGLDPALADNKRLVFCNGQQNIGHELTLFSDVTGNISTPSGNRLLFGPTREQNDTFRHEQNLIISEDGHDTVIAGCAHAGIVNILHRAEQIIGRPPTHVLAGMHLVKSGLTSAEEDTFIQHLATSLGAYPLCRFYTMHCTGPEAYHKLKKLLGEKISYLACGDSIEY